MRELRLSRLSRLDSLLLDRRRSEPANLRNFSFLTGFVTAGIAGIGGTLDFLLRMLNFEIHEEAEAGDAGLFIEERVEEDHLERKTWLVDADEG